MATPTALPSFCAPWTGDARAYAVAASVRSAKAAFKRCRTLKHFILRVGSRDYQRPCSKCGCRLDGPISKTAQASISNYTFKPGVYCFGIYLPGTKAVALMHYECGWLGVFSDLSKLKAH